MKAEFTKEFHYLPADESAATSYTPRSQKVGFVAIVDEEGLQNPAAAPTITRAVALDVQDGVERQLMSGLPVGSESSPPLIQGATTITATNDLKRVLIDLTGDLSSYFKPRIFMDAETALR